MKTTFWRALAVAQFVLMLGIAALSLESLADRRDLRGKQEAGAEIQTILIRRAMEDRHLTEREKARISELCRPAGYDRVRGGCEGLR